MAVDPEAEFAALAAWRRAARDSGAVDEVMMYN